MVRNSKTLIPQAEATSYTFTLLFSTNTVTGPLEPIARNKKASAPWHWFTRAAGLKLFCTYPPPRNSLRSSSFGLRSCQKPEACFYDGGGPVTRRQISHGQS